MTKRGLERFALVFAHEKAVVQSEAIWCNLVQRGRPDPGEGVYLYRKQRMEASDAEQSPKGWADQKFQDNIALHSVY